MVDALTWAVANQLAGEIFTSQWIGYWNASARLAVFVLFALLLSSMRRVLERERELARRDFVTGALNGRAFNEIAAAEIRRAKRYSRAFTIAYIDIDNFKLVNDRFGHSVGDTLLVTVARIISDSLRGSDVVARLGGDEFAIMLPEAGQAAAQVAVAKIRERLLAAVTEHRWPVTFSIGVLSCKAPPDTVDELIRQADAAMYAVKRDGKNAIRYATHPA